jgi:hypothetical protein
MAACTFIRRGHGSFLIFRKKIDVVLSGEKIGRERERERDGIRKNRCMVLLP